MSFVTRTALALLTAGLLTAGAASFVLPRQQAARDAAPEPTPIAISQLPATDRTAGPSLIERSPFAQNRSAFARNAGPPAPEIEVKLAGIFKMGKEMRANLVIGGQSVVVRKGDETPVGTVASIESSAVVLEGASPRRLEMFKQ